MPLFNFECTGCGHIVEKIQRGKDLPEITCSECEKQEFKKLLSTFRNRTWLDATELIKQKIAPDAERIKREMRKGNDNHFSDIYGEK